MLTHVSVSSTAIEDISRHCRTSRSLAFAYFYFEFDGQDTQSNNVLHNILRSLMKQLGFQCGNVPNPLEKLFSEYADGLRSPALEELMSTLKTIIASFEHVYIIFDALDECQDRRHFLKVLKQMHGWELSTLHLLATSRQEHDIARVLDTLVSHDVQMEQTLVNGDIHVHVSKMLDHDDEFKMLPVKERKLVENTLADGASGM